MKSKILFIVDSSIDLSPELCWLAIFNYSIKCTIDGKLIVMFQKSYQIENIRYYDEKKYYQRQVQLLCLFLKRKGGKRWL